MHDPLQRERAHLLKEALREELNNPEHGDALKALFKEALAEWLDEQWARFGRWTFHGIAAAAFTVLLYLLAKAKGVL